MCFLGANIIVNEPQLNFFSNLFSNKESTSKDVEVLNQYLGVNDHLKGINRGSAAPRSGLEKKIDHAIELGEFNTAEKLSDRLATREVNRYD